MGGWWSTAAKEKRAATEVGGADAVHLPHTPIPCGAKALPAKKNQRTRFAAFSRIQTQLCPHLRPTTLSNRRYARQLVEDLIHSEQTRQSFIVITHGEGVAGSGGAPSGREHTIGGRSKDW